MQGDCEDLLRELFKKLENAGHRAIDLKVCENETGTLVVTIKYSGGTSRSHAAPRRQQSFAEPPTRRDHSGQSVDNARTTRLRDHSESLSSRSQSNSTENSSSMSGARGQYNNQNNLSCAGQMTSVKSDRIDKLAGLALKREGEHPSEVGSKPEIKVVYQASGNGGQLRANAAVPPLRRPEMRVTSPRETSRIPASRAERIAQTSVKERFFWDPAEGASTRPAREETLVQPPKELRKANDKTDPPNMASMAMSQNISVNGGSANDKISCRQYHVSPRPNDMNAPRIRGFSARGLTPKKEMLETGVGKIKGRFNISSGSAEKLPSSTKPNESDWATDVEKIECTLNINVSDQVQGASGQYSTYEQMFGIFVDYGSYEFGQRVQDPSRNRSVNRVVEYPLEWSKDQHYFCVFDDLILPVWRNNTTGACALPRRYVRIYRDWLTRAISASPDLMPDSRAPACMSKLGTDHSLYNNIVGAAMAVIEKYVRECSKNYPVAPAHAHSLQS